MLHYNGRWHGLGPAWTERRRNPSEWDAAAGSLARWWRQSAFHPPGNDWLSVLASAFSTIQAFQRRRHRTDALLRRPYRRRARHDPPRKHWRLLTHGRRLCDTTFVHVVCAGSG